jgi:hypothetical protein
MSYWIEVTTGIRWTRLSSEGRVRLDAPNTSRYQTFFQGLKSGDFVLHYLTGVLTPEKEKRSSIVGVSLIESNPIIEGKKITAKCSKVLEFAKPVSYKELCGVEPKSVPLRKLLKLSMQRYLTQISMSDFESILNVHPANMRRFSKSRLIYLKN